MPTVAPASARDLDAYRARADRFLADLDEEYYLHFAGLKDRLELEPIYREFPGWTQSTRGIRDFDKLPISAQQYLHALEELAGCPIAMVSTGPDREENVILRDAFA